jgi:hypothetical protein
MSDPRTQLLDTMFDRMTSYLVNECPGDTNWEDFDPEIDSLRAEVGDLLERHNRLEFPPRSIPAR